MPTFIDRRVKVVIGSDDQHLTLTKVSDLREVDFFVLLGEPGIGKSTAFEREAEFENLHVTSVRDAVDDEPTGAATLFLDGLDEYRSEGQHADKVRGLAKVIKKSGAKRWRLSCRAEDWRNEADIAAVQRTTEGAAIVVAQLLPLDYREARDILRSFGEENPEGFLDKAFELGAQAFTENPMSLRLLREAVKGGQNWPKTRFELFDRATTSLSHESNIEHKAVRDRPTAEQIKQAAGKICLRLLISGADYVWRSSDQPPDTQNNRRSFLGASDLNIEPALLNAVLDTPLFRGEGQVFAPAHRTVAEFLAARELAALISNKEEHALPVRRVSALIASADGTPPTELRGLYGWLTAHLSHQGETDFAQKLVVSDPVTALGYGDAAVLDTETRRLLLATIGDRDPFFRASNVGVTAFVGLAGEDLSDDFRAILESAGEQSHRKYTVLEVLTTGQPVLSLRSVLRTLILDVCQAEWIRERAVEALENGLATDDTILREIFLELESESPSVAREALRAKIAAKLWPAHLSVAELRSVLQGFESRPDDNTVGRLTNLQAKVEIEPNLSLFDLPSKDWRCDRTGRYHIHELDGFLSATLAAGIKADLDQSPSLLLERVRNARYYRWDDVAVDVSAAIRAWIAHRPGRAAELFHAVLSSQPADAAPWVGPNEFLSITRTDPAEGLLQELFEEAKCEIDLDAKKRMLSAIVELALHKTVPFKIYWAIHEYLTLDPEFDELRANLEVNAIPAYKIVKLGDLVARQAAAEAEKRRIIDILEPRIKKLSSGTDVQNLDWFSTLYFGGRRLGTDDAVGVDETNPTIAAAALSGCVELALHFPSDLSPTKLGELEAKSSRYYAEFPAIVGLDALISNGETPPNDSASLSLAIAVLKSSYVAERSGRQQALINWAVERLLHDVTAGATALSDFWAAILNAGYNNLKGLESLKARDDTALLLKPAIGSILSTFRAASADALRAALFAALELFEVSEISTFAKAALNDPAAAGETRQIWILVAFLIEPEQNSDEFQREFSVPGGHASLDNYFAGEMRTRLPAKTDRDRAIRDAAYIRSLAPITAPAGEGRYRSEEMRVRNAIDGLGENPSVEADGFLREFVATTAHADWLPYLRHAAARRARLEVDRNFVHPTPDQINKALSNGPPVNSSDLFAITMEELEILKTDIRLGQNSSWKRFWNLDGSDVTTPLIENEARNYLLDRLGDRLKKYSIHEATPEARRANDTRADVLILNGAGRNLPIEVKRHFHPDVWKAASTQLQGYATAPGADGFGVLLVFWYGPYQRPPARPDASTAPSTSAEMEAMLIQDLPEHLRKTTGVIVIDVSDPDPTRTAAKKEKKLEKAATPKPKRPTSST